MIASTFDPVIVHPGRTPLGCLRGVSTQTGFGLAAKIGNFHRFTGASIGSVVGLTPALVLLRGLPGPGTDHQDRQRPRPRRLPVEAQPVPGGSTPSGTGTATCLMDLFPTHLARHGGTPWGRQSSPPCPLTVYSGKPYFKAGADRVPPLSEATMKD